MEETKTKDRVQFWTRAHRQAFGKRLQLLRLQKDLSLEQVAGWFRSTRARIGHWETGERVPDAAAIAQLCERFETSADYLLLGYEQWPFRRVKLQRVKSVSPDDRLRLEGALIMAASSMGIDIEGPEAGAPADASAKQS